MRTAIVEKAMPPASGAIPPEREVAMRTNSAGVFITGGHPDFDVHTIIYERLHSHFGEEKVGWRQFSEYAGSQFHLTKLQSRRLARLFANAGVVEICPHWIRFVELEAAE